MANRSDLPQKRKQQMGILAQPTNHQHADGLGSESYERSRLPYQGYGGVIVERNAGYRPKTNKSRHQKETIPEISSTNIVSVGRARGSEQVGNLSTVSNGRGYAGVILHKGGSLDDLQDHQGTSSRHISDGKLFLTDQIPYVSDLQIREISKAAQKLNMNLKAYSDGLIFDKDSIAISHELLAGAKHLEKSLNMLGNLQEESQLMERPQGKQIKLLPDKEVDGTFDLEAEQSVTSSRPRFSFNGVLRFFIKNTITSQCKKGNKYEKKQTVSSYPEQKTSQQLSSEPESSNALMHSISQKQSASSSLVPNKSTESSSNASLVSYGEKVSRDPYSKETNGDSIYSNNKLDAENKQLVSSHGGKKHEKSGISNVISKLMGLEEISSLKMEPKSDNRQTDRMSKQGNTSVHDSITLSQKSSSKNLKKQLQEIGGTKSGAQDILVSGKRKASLKKPNTEEKRNMALTNQQKLKSWLTQKKTELVNRDQNEVETAWRRQNMKQKQKCVKLQVVQEISNGNKQKNALQQSHGPRSPRCGSGNKNSKGLEGTNKSLLKEEQVKENDSLAMPCHDFKTANYNGSLDAIQRSRLDLAVGRALVTDKNGVKNKINSIQGQKNILLEINPRESSCPLSYKRTDACMPEIATRIRSLVKASEFTRPAQVPILKTIENTLEENKRDDSLEMEKDIHTAESRVSTFMENTQLIRREDTITSMKLVSLTTYGYQGLPIKSPRDTQEVHSYQGTSDDEPNSTYNYLRHQNLTRQEKLTEDESYLMNIVIGNQDLLDTIQALFKLKINVSIIQGDEIFEDNESKLTLDCAYEIMRRREKIEEFKLHRQCNLSSSLLKVRSLVSVIKDLNNEMKTPYFSGENGESEYTTAESLRKMVDDDIRDKKPYVNCTWDLGWNCKIFASQEMNNTMEDIEKLIFNALVEEVVAIEMHALSL